MTFFVNFIKQIKTFKIYEKSNTTFGISFIPFINIL